MTGIIRRIKEVIFLYTCGNEISVPKADDKAPTSCPNCGALVYMVIFKVEESDQSGPLVMSKYQ